MKKQHPYHEAVEEGFICPYCGSAPTEIKIINSRPTLVAGFRAKRRQKHCQICDSRYTTYEIHSEDLDALIASHGLLLGLEAHLDAIKQ